jgi:hypothetical protein
MDSTEFGLHTDVGMPFHEEVSDDDMDGGPVSDVPPSRAATKKSIRKGTRKVSAVPCPEPAIADVSGESPTLPHISTLSTGCTVGVIALGAVGSGSGSSGHSSKCMSACPSSIISVSI